MDHYEIICGASRRKLRIPLTEAGGSLVSASGASAVLVGYGVDNSEIVINKWGTIEGGYALFDEMGLLVSSEQVGVKRHGTVRCQVMYSDADGTDFTPWFELWFVRQPAQLAALYEVFMFNDLHKLVRMYPFDVAPRAVRNTFTGSSASLERPAFYVTTSGINTSKVYEVAIESGINDVVFEGPDSTDDYSYPFLVDGTWWCNANTSSLLDDDAWCGVEFLSHESNGPWPSAPTHPVVQLRQNLKTKTSWQLLSAKGDGVTPAAIAAFTLPDQNPGGFGEGHRVALFIDRKNATIKAWVDGVVRATLTGEANMPDWGAIANTARVGLFFCTGVMGSPGTSLAASWTAFRVTSLGTGLPFTAL